MDFIAAERDAAVETLAESVLPSRLGRALGNISTALGAATTAYGIWNDEMRTLTNPNSTGEQRGEAAFYAIMDTAAAIPLEIPGGQFITPAVHLGLEALRPGVRQLTVNSGRLGTWAAERMNVIDWYDRLTGRALEPVMKPVQ